MLKNLAWRKIYAENLYRIGPWSKWLRDETRNQKVVSLNHCAGYCVDIVAQQFVLFLWKDRNYTKRGRGWPLFLKPLRLEVNVHLCWHFTNLQDGRNVALKIHFVRHQVFLHVWDVRCAVRFTRQERVWQVGGQTCHHQQYRKTFLPQRTDWWLSKLFCIILANNLLHVSLTKNRFIVNNKSSFVWRTNAIVACGKQLRYRRS